MKRGKEDDKAVRPMFPRLHVNDADRGGPRAPPRNKMALYEQLSIPSQRFNPTALPPPNPGTLAPSASSSKGGTHERTVLSPFYPPKSMPTQSAEKACSRSPDGKYVNTMGMELERSFCRVDNKYSRSAGSIAVGSSLSAHDQSCGKKFCKKKLDDDDDDDFRVPTFNQVGSIQQFKEANLVDLSKSAPLGPSILQKTSSSRLNSSIQVPSSDGKPVDEANASEILSKANNRNHDEQRSTEPLVENDHNSPTYPEADVMHADNSKVLLLASDVGVQTKMVKTNYLNSQIHGESTDKGALDGRGCINKAEILEKMNSSWIRSQSCSRESLEHIHGSNVNAENWPGLLNNSDKSDEISETSMVDSISGLEISPDDVVGIIGPKQFWKARRAIVNQQRVFAIQVFELHRLIKVQKLFASSPHLLLDNPHVTKIQPKASSKSLPMPSSLKLQLHVVHQRDESPQMPTHMIADCLVDKATVLPLQTQERGQLPRYAPQAGNQPSFPMTHHDNSPSTWYFPPTASQWLIPVMSPSEGLVYKPYSGPCPPSAGFMAPFYGGCGHLTLPPITNDFMNAAYAVPALHTQQPNPGVLPASPAIGPNYFPAPYGMPVTNTLVSASAIEQSIPLNGTDPNKHVAQHSRNSCNMSITGSEALSDCAPKNYPSRGSEVQGSTASSPCDRTRGKGRDALPLFPTSPAAGCSGLPSQSSGREYQINVIKVVPHNARSATESAARIFKSIQEERKQLEW